MDLLSPAKWRKMENKKLFEKIEEKYSVMKMTNNKILQLIKLKQQILDVECNLRTLKQNNTKSSFEYAKIKINQLKYLKEEFRQVEQELQDLLEKEEDNNN